MGMSRAQAWIADGTNVETEGGKLVAYTTERADPNHDNPSATRSIEEAAAPDALVAAAPDLLAAASEARDVLAGIGTENCGAWGADAARLMDTLHAAIAKATGAGEVQA